MKQAIYTPMTTKKFRQRTADMLGKKQNQATKIRLSDARQKAGALMSRMQDAEAEMVTPIKSQADYVTQSLDSWHSSIMEREPFENPKINAPVKGKSADKNASTTEEFDMDKLVDFVAKEEGFRAKAYEDIKQISVGFGTVATDINEVITEEEAKLRLKEELQKSYQAVLRAEKKYNYNFTAAQKYALTSFTFNLGSGEGTSDKNPRGLKQLLDVGRRGIEEISDSIELYNKGGGKVLEGLVKRRANEYKVFNEGL